MNRRYIRLLPSKKSAKMDTQQENAQERLLRFVFSGIENTWEVAVWDA